uniref:Spectrin beta chain n=1 Tax=Cyprinus carpio carpio TaxID=630221 RepID=A0A8C1FLF3_CYPCA
MTSTTDFDNAEITQQYSRINTRFELSDEELDNDNSSARLFERSRIKALADEREAVQKKTFTKWVNSILARVSCRISDLYLDLRDGRMLIKLLEVLSGERLPKPTKGRMRIHCLENVDKALQFLKEQRVHLENMGSHDIVDGNHRLILGLIWTIILRFQIQDIIVETGQADQTGRQETRSAKDALLLWCQMKTAGYPNVNITNFTTSWKDGMAFNALIHKHRPDLVDYGNLQRSNPTHNLQQAFNVAEKKLGVTKLLDPEDVFTENPDEKSIITYVVAFYHYFSKMKALAVEGKRVGKVLDQAIETEKMTEKYETLSSDLLTWIEQTIIVLNNRKLANSLAGVQQQLQAFNSYRTVEKPPKFQEKGNLEVLLFTIQSRMRANNQRVYTPKEGALVSDINKAWERLEKAEHDRERVLRDELIRQEKLEQMARRFDRKAAMRETWLLENQRLVSQDNFGYDLPAVEAAKKKHDAIETDIAAYEERVQALVALSKELEAERYHDAKRIDARKDNILRLWDYLQELLKARRGRLDKNLTLQRIFQEMLHIITWMDEMKSRLLSPDFGKHLLEVEDLLQKHSLLEADIAVQAERVRSANAAALKFANGDSYKPCDPQVIRDRVQHLDLCYQELCALAAQRKVRLEQSRRLWNFLWEIAELEGWIREKEHIFSSLDYGKDLTSVLVLQSKHSVFEDELAARRDNLKHVMDEGESMIQAKHLGSPKVQQRMDDVRNQWQQLEELAAFRKQNLLDTQCFFQFQGDADDLKAWLVDAMRQMSSDDIGHDEYTTQRLLKKHRDLRDEAAKNGGTIDTLSKQANALPEELRDTPDIQGRLSDIRDMYIELLTLSDLRQKKLDDTMALYTIFSETDACELWMGQKETWLVGLETPENLEDLEVVQNRLSILAQEMGNIQARVDDVNKAAKQLEDSRHPQTKQVKDCQTRLNRRWEAFKAMVEDKKHKVDSALSLHNYDLECDETESWIKEKTRVIESTQDLGNDLAAVITIQRKLFGMERDLAAIQDKLDFLRNEAQKLVKDHPENASDIFARQQELDAAWYTLKRTLKNREDSLGEVSKLQTFLQDMDDFQAWLFKTQKEYTLAHIDKSDTLDGAEKALKKHEDFVTTMDANEEKILSTLETGQRLVDSGNLYSERVNDKMGSIEDRSVFFYIISPILHPRSDIQRNLHKTFLFDLLTLWINEKMLTAQDTSYDEARNLHSKWQKHQAFMAELASNKDWLHNIDKEGQELMDSKPEFEPIVTDRLAKLHELWDKLESTTQEKARLLFDANRSELFDQSLADLKKWLAELQQQLQGDVDEEVKDLTSANILLKKHQMTENQVRDRARELEELQEAVEQHASLREDQPELEVEQQTLQRDFQKLFTPLAQRRGKLEAAKAVHQFFRDLADEILWVNERLPMAMSEDHGNNLQTVQLLLKKNQVSQGCPEEEQMSEEMKKLQEAEAWIGEQELYMISDEKAKDEQSAMVMLKRHLLMKQVVDDYAHSIQLLADRSQKMLAEEHPDGEAIIRRKGQVDKQYAGLKELAEDRKKQLDHTYHHFLLSREVEDLDHWIAERDVVASSQEMGQDLDHVTILQDKFREFARETGTVGQERVDTVNRIIDEMIETGHSEAATLAEWKDGINESWADLLELVDTRAQHLKASYDLYFDDGKELVAHIEEKKNELPDDLGEDFSKAESFHRMHAAFERAISSLGKQVKQFQETATRLYAQYAGDQATAIQVTEKEVVEAWNGLLAACAGRRKQLEETADKFRFFTMVRDLLAWMESIIQQIETQEKPRDVSSVELLMKYHQGIRAEIETRGPKFNQCVELGRALLERKHKDSEEINDKLVQLVEKRKEMMLKWDERWDWLRLLLEVCQFARDASVAEAWLIAQEPYVASRDLGETVDEVEKLLKRHEAFEKSTATWEERFSALERLTTLELMEIRKQQQDILQYRQEVEKDSRYICVSDGTAGDSTVPLISEMQESGSLELDPSTSFQVTKEAEKAATLPTESSQVQPVLMEGTLSRKHEMEGPNKKASNRSWNNLYCVLKPGQLSAYKDAKSFSHSVTYHGEEPLNLSNASCEILTNYKKKKLVFKLQLEDGSEYLFQCKDEEELQNWTQAIEQAAQALTEEPVAGPSGVKAQSLPPPSSTTLEVPSTKKEKEKRFSLFAKKK